MNQKENLSNDPKNSTSVIRLAINSDPARAIEFNPYSLSFRMSFLRFIKDFEVKRVEYYKHKKEIDSNAELAVKLEKELCEWMIKKIDALFGNGTSKKAFGDSLTLDMFSQFFEGIKPYIHGVYVQKNFKHR